MCEEPVEILFTEKHLLDRPLAHLGEAQTCYVIKNWDAFGGAWWISDDRDALRYARLQAIIAYETIDLMSVAVADGEIGAAAAYRLIGRMAESGRRLRLPKNPDELAR